MINAEAQYPCSVNQSIEEVHLCLCGSERPKCASSNIGPCRGVIMLVKIVMTFEEVMGVIWFE